MGNVVRKIFFDEELNASFYENGYCIVKNAVSDDILNKLEGFYAQHSLPAPDSFHTTMFQPDKDYRQMVHEFIVENLQPVIERLLVRYKPFLGNYIVKEANETKSLDMHQDWSFVNEAEFDSVNMWCPLCSVDETNGALLMLKGSNKLNNLERSPTTPITFIEKYAEWATHLTPCPMLKGDVILFNSRIVHSSFLNKSNKPRVAITLTSIPYEAQAYHYHQQGNSVVKYKIDVPFYYTYQIGMPPVNEYQPADE